MSLVRLIQNGDESNFLRLADKALVPEDEREYALRSQVSDWIEKGNEPDIDGFLHFYPEWKNERFSDIIESEFKRRKELCHGKKSTPWIIGD